MDPTPRGKKKIERPPAPPKPVEASEPSPTETLKTRNPKEEEEAQDGENEGNETTSEDRLDNDTTDYSRSTEYDPAEEDYTEPPPEPKPSRIRKKEPGHHIDLEAAIAEASDSPPGINQLEALMAKTPPELRKILEDEFSAEFLGPIRIDPSKLN